MKNKMSIVLSLISLTACGKAQLSLPGGATLSVDTTSISTTASADVAQCASGMTLIPAGIGHGAFCIDNAKSATQMIHASAGNDCANRAIGICSIIELQAACALGHIDTTTDFWSSDVTAGISSVSYARSLSGISCANAGLWTISQTAYTKYYYCCSR